MSKRSSVSSHDITKESKLSRKEEKDHLQGLNNRLAGYIDKVRQLQTENKKMTTKITKLEEHQQKEVKHVTTIYEKEKRDIETAITELSKQYRELQNIGDKVLRETKT